MTQFLEALIVWDFALSAAEVLSEPQKVTAITKPSRRVVPLTQMLLAKSQTIRASKLRNLETAKSCLSYLCPSNNQAIHFTVLFTSNLEHTKGYQQNYN